jgi:hypothetical protein
MNHRNLLPEHYILQEHDVYCGRGSQCFNHEGNRKFRQIVLDYLDRYSEATGKYDKSAIIDEIVFTVRRNSPFGGGFIKKDTKTGRFYEVGDFLAVSKKQKKYLMLFDSIFVFLIFICFVFSLIHEMMFVLLSQREKTSQAFRDALQEKSKQSDSRSDKKMRLLNTMKNEGNLSNVSSYQPLSTQLAIPPNVVSISDSQISPLFTAATTNTNSEPLSYVNKHILESSASSPSKLSPINKPFESIFDLLSARKINQYDNTRCLNVNDALCRDFSNGNGSRTSFDYENEKEPLESIFDLLSAHANQQFTNESDQTNPDTIATTNTRTTLTAITTPPTYYESSSDSLFFTSKQTDTNMPVRGLSRLDQTSNELNLAADNASSTLKGTTDYLTCNTGATIDSRVASSVIGDLYPLIKASSKMNKQEKCTMAKNYQISTTNNDNLLDDRDTFDILFQLTASYPDLGTCPFLRLNHSNQSDNENNKNVQNKESNDGE